MTVYDIFLIKAELFYILFMETVRSRKLEDATVLGIFLDLRLPASSAAASGLGITYKKLNAHCRFILDLPSQERCDSTFPEANQAKCNESS